MISEKTRETLRNAFTKAGEILREHAGSAVQTRIKENLSSVLTDADLASEQRILEILSGTDSPCNILSEEGKGARRKRIAPCVNEDTRPQMKRPWVK
jgi:3'-phosphoadenosine 5'-phosphosulfate (PAPS) 3'-phosphatase